MTPMLGQMVRSFFEDYLKVQKGLRPASIRSYRDTLRLFLNFVSKERRRPIIRLDTADLTVDRALVDVARSQQTVADAQRALGVARRSLETLSGMPVPGATGSMPMLYCSARDTRMPTLPVSE